MEESYKTLLHFTRIRYNNPMNDALHDILSHKPNVDAFLTDYLAGRKRTLAAVNSWGSDVIERLIRFVTGGKTTRGSLTVYIYTLFTKQPAPRIYQAAAALELFHSGFLIHDDIMDNDSMRRGRESIWQQYATASGDIHVGVSQAINAGDICFFMGQELLADMGLAGLVSRELQPVIVAQMQDVMSGRGNALSKDDVLTLYRYKTARYTFSLSMCVGATVAQAGGEYIQVLSRLGESMGLLYQIRDDELSISGHSDITGKPVGSDVANEKQTLATLLNSEEINDLKGSLLEHSDKEIGNLPISDRSKDSLRALVTFCITRDK